ncbi:MAG TPA: histidine kinase dimerization/phospho-acceptor domain-containing protein, partial [Desulfosporosinus sp.]|nr:histidine kinase dimerization/phospho-acceptor domain-containing protein [Desulfosporosinus sp.]
MFRSIRYKLFLYMIINVVLFAVLLYGANILFAQKYYTYYKKTVLIESSQKISDLLKGLDPSKEAITDDIQFQINRVERSIGGTAFVGTLAGQLYYPASRNNEPLRPDARGNPFYILNQDNAQTIQIVSPRDQRPVPAKKDVTSWERYTDKSFFVTLEDPALKIESIRFQTELDNGLVLLVWVPIAQISESVAVFNRLTSIITLVIIIITGIWAFFISRSFTRPITQMNFITKKMAEMDFSQTLNVAGKDEISQLSGNINDLSDKLDRAIGELNSKNQQLELDIGHERKLDKLRKVFISSVSHELKTPIFLIQGYAEGLKTNVVIDEEKRNFYCDVIIEEADKMDIL